MAARMKQNSPGRALLARPAAKNPAPAPTITQPVPTQAGLARPIDPFREAAIGSAQRDYAGQMQQAQYAQSQLGSSFGLGITPQGGVYDDPTNPFSRAAVMQAAYTRNKNATTNSMASRGQLYSGALQRGQDTNALNHERGRDQLIREFHAAQQAIQNAQLQASNQLQDRTANADAESIQRAIAERTDALTAMGALTPAASAGGGLEKPTVERGKDSKGRLGKWHTYSNGRRVFVRDK